MAIDAKSIESIKNLAEKAIKGDWYAVGAWVETSDENEPDPVTIITDDHEADWLERLKENARYIAAVQPAVVLEMIAEIKRWREGR